ncbi:hypothetical protein CONCODRAFT_79278 [Conidiobolus coronatus NRRL 28638]|uniref:Signal recognition particle 9 kDa protein n=1 Tax=Conidiobolus coronatus (strain ATCC 28846 / CBS 209.66 / NRRL 28638) TaxID=796925 RepID=A0A137P3M3_CONC2|nr:hypothetical protein CONCODRAFT_79278 [Conidiobolus coronatus NRRL 28638]|eukprot:KXN69494.1 hypothetical protein CONCODRAFT_79278 [Conidiobolus coronatus NRRL 28638]
MVWLNDLELFIKESLSLTEQHPDKTRLSYKYRAVDGKLIVKVTNDTITLKFATDQMQDLKRLEKLVKSAMYNFVQCDEEAEESQNTGIYILIKYAIF